MSVLRTAKELAEEFGPSPIDRIKNMDKVIELFSSMEDVDVAEYIQTIQTIGAIYKFATV